jgi:hypothetical protein
MNTSTNKSISKQELLSLDELNNFKKYIENKYSPSVVQNECIVKTINNFADDNYTIEFTFNQKYGTDIVDFIYDPVLVYQQQTQQTQQANNNPMNLKHILSPDDMIELVHNESVIESMSFSTLIAKLKLSNKQITNIGSKTFVPFDFGVLMSGFVVNINDLSTLKVSINIKNASQREINLDDYMGFQLKYKSYISSKYKIKNSHDAIKQLNNYFSQSSNKKLLEKQNNVISKIFVEKEFDHALAPAPAPAPVQLTTNLNHIKTSQKNINSFDIRDGQSLPSFRSVQPLQNYNDIVNSLHNQIAQDGCIYNYDYDNVMAFNSMGATDNVGDGFQGLINYEFNDEIEEYKTSKEDINQVYFKKEKLFNKRVSLFCELTKEIKINRMTNDSINFQSSSLTNIYFYFTNQPLQQPNLFDSVRLKLNGKTVYETEMEILTLNVEENNSNYNLYMIPINLNLAETKEADNYELIFYGMDCALSDTGIKLFEVSKHLCYYEPNSYNYKPNLVKF